jgi:1,4-alpha-glucan branching enzyme
MRVFMNTRIIFAVLFLSGSLFAQTTFISTPQYPGQTDSIVITFDISKANPQGKTTLSGYSGTVYAHTGVTIQIGAGTPQEWQNVIGNWGDNTRQPALKQSGSSDFTITIKNPRDYYNVTDPAEQIIALNFVLRSSDGNKQTENITIPIYNHGIRLVLNSPRVNTSYGDPARSPVFADPAGSINISASTSELGTKTKSIALFVNGILKTESSTNSLSYTFTAAANPAWSNEIKLIAADTANIEDSAKFVIDRYPSVKDAPLPAGNQIGINYGTDGTKTTLALYAPYKKSVFVIGDFNGWKVDSTYLMNRYQVTPDSVIWWTTLSNLTPGQEYAYQFLIDGSLRVQDPYTEKILDPDNDSDPELQKVYPNLMPYPYQKTSGIVSVLQTAQTPYAWKVNGFSRVSKEKLFIYELLVRDFISTHSYTTLKDTLGYFKKLGVTAIELMPINEFEGNSSWGYNPMMYFAPDKYYGTKKQLKDFIDAAHQNGIAVIMDIVLNHSYGSSPMVAMYWDTTNSRPAANSPWFNQVSPNPVYSWGYDFNHESKATKYFVDRVTSFWLTEYKMDGFRFDFTKGFTNTPGEGTPYDPSRIAILERIANKIWGVSKDAYMICESFTENREEIELANYGMMIWGNENYTYNQATMGYASGWDFGSGSSGVSYLNRGYSAPGLVGYMESHDEERLMFKNERWGNSSGSYIIKIPDSNTPPTVALNRMKLAASFFITVPGPKMIWEFGELGFDYSIGYPGVTITSPSDATYNTVMAQHRLDPKPAVWNYLSDNDRKSLFNVFAGLIRLKKSYPAFSSSSFTMNTSGFQKSIHINDPSMNVTILGNFDVSDGSISPVFQSTGKWYEFFTGDSLNVTDTGAQISLQPGEYRLYTSKKLPRLSDLITSVQNREIIPVRYRLDQNYPNPFNPSTLISYQLPANSFVTLKVYDVLGREVATLVNENQWAGVHKVEFNKPLASGVYFYRIEAGKFVESKKMVLLK